MATPKFSSPLHRLASFKDPPPPAPPAVATAPSPLAAFAADPVFSAFFSPTFSSSAFSSAALASGSAAARAESLQDAIRLLHRHLRSLVLLHHPHLLLHLSSLHSASSSLASLRHSLQSLTSSLRRSRADLSQPRHLLLQHTAQLSNLHSTADLLQSTSRLLKLSHRLRSLLAKPSLDLSKAAEMHREIEILYQERGLAGISVVENEIIFLSETGARLRFEAINLIEKGMEESNQNDIWCGLQVFYNLGELRSTVDALVNKWKGMGVKSVGAALDMKAVSAAGAGFGPGGVQRSGTPQIGGGKRAGEALWERMGRCVEEVHRVVTAVWHLQMVLAKKRVPFTQVLFLHEVWQALKRPVPGFSVNTVDTKGAGDVFVGSLLVSIANEQIEKILPRFRRLAFLTLFFSRKARAHVGRQWRKHLQDGTFGSHLNKNPGGHSMPREINPKAEGRETYLRWKGKRRSPESSSRKKTIPNHKTQSKQDDERGQECVTVTRNVTDKGHGSCNVSQSKLWDRTSRYCVPSDGSDDF